MESYKAPEKYPKDNKFTIFLGGTIEIGNSIDWQKTLTESLKEFDVRILNPRRDDFDKSAEQSIKNPYFKDQVNWELDGLDRADIIVMNLLKDSLSPISMMEIGLYTKENKRMFICCPDGFWRKGNIEVIVDRYRYSENLIIFNDYNNMVKKLKEVCKDVK